MATPLVVVAPPEALEMLQGMYTLALADSESDIVFEKNPEL